MSYGIGDFLADVATGGAYSATKTTVEAGAKLSKEIFEETGNVASAVAGAAAAAGAGAGVCAPGTTAGTLCCPRYQIVGDFLLETMTGRVWRYDGNSGAFAHVPKRVPPFLGAYLKHKQEEAKGSMQELAKKIAVAAYPKNHAVMLKQVATDLSTALEEEFKGILPK